MHILYGICLAHVCTYSVYVVVCMYVCESVCTTKCVHMNACVCFHGTYGLLLLSKFQVKCPLQQQGKINLLLKMEIAMVTISKGIL